MKLFLFLSMLSINGFASDVIHSKDISLNVLVKEYCKENSEYVGEKICIKSIKTCLDSKSYFVEVTPEIKAQIFLECIDAKK